MVRRFAHALPIDQTGGMIPAGASIRTTIWVYCDTAVRVLVLLLCVVCTARANERLTDLQASEYFERKIRPLLAEHCFSCHSTDAQTVHGGLLLDSMVAIQQGGDSGPAIDREQLENSLLLQVVRYDGDIQMPPEGKLAASVIAEFTRWVELGAPIPDTPTSIRPPDTAIDFVTGREFWSFQPAQLQPTPSVQDPSWPKSRMDLFVLEAMERAGLHPSPRADRASLIRRLSFDLIGLPPSPEEVHEFVHDESPMAYVELVDRLLASPRYGEKWGRMWLDLARYTDRTASWLYATDQAHLYRDWIFAAFNADMPYDQFVHRQLATDMMPETGLDDLPALGFLSLSPTYWKELKLPCEIINTIVADEWEERVDAVSSTFLGLTVACARCHDHKFDPISSEDYYALAGVFASCRQSERPMIPDAEYQPVQQAKAEVSKLDAEIAELKKKKPLPKEEIDALVAKVDDIRHNTPNYDTPMTNVVTEESLYVVRAGKTPQDGTRLDYHPEPRDLPLFIRGNPNRPGPIIPRRFLTVLSSTRELTPPPFVHGSGRLELARAITTDAASLTARVIVNRVWLEHFGQGLVTTPSNFGLQGSPPTHPELLDDLAARFIAGGWHIKDLHREILLSATWQQSSEFDASKTSLDPDNRWLSRMNRRRLNFESWRDAMLVASDSIDFSLGGPSIELDSADNHRRTVYATIHRHEMSTTLRIHDFPDPTQHSPARTATTTALQGLYALNGPLLSLQADALSRRLAQEVADNPDRRIERAYELLYSRAACESEKQLAIRFLASADEPTSSARWIQYLHVLLASNELLYVD